MFWRFGGYANVSTIDTILERENFQLEDLLNEGDLIQELKQHNAKLVEYLRDAPVLEKLLDYVIAPRPEIPAAEDDQAGEEKEPEGNGKGVALPSRPRASSSTTDPGEENDAEALEKKRNRYAFVAAEILSSDNWSIYEALMESKDLLSKFWQFLKRPVPLDNLQASYFTKVNESLFDKKTDDMLVFLRSLDGVVADILKHVDCPNIMDLLLRIISLERTESGQGIVEWLYTQNLVPTLLSFLGPEHAWSTQTSAGDFLKAIITVSANASQNEQTCIGPNELTRQLVSKPCVEQLIKYMLGGGNPLTCGVGIIIEVIRKNNSDYDPDGAEPNAIPSSRDPIYLGTLLRLFAQHIPDFMNLILNGPNQKDSMLTSSGQTIKPLGFDRFKTCELMAELLHCSNMGLLNEPGAEEAIAARDAHRQRLREEGQLNPMRVDDAPSSTEDLTMRMSQSSPAVERRLGVTNVSEDDGFEEVTNTPDDDSSHGVVELPEAPLPPSGSSFLYKDEDDFVDEPLSSPRLNTRELDPQDDEQDIDRDIPPRPASPTKRSMEEEVEPAEESPARTPAEASATSEAKEASSEIAPEKTQTIAAEPEQEAAETSTSTGATLPAETVSESTESGKVKVTVEPAEDKAPVVEGLSPHPEDTPPPLFAGQEGSTAGTAPAAIPTKPASSSSQQAPASSDPEAEIAKQISVLEQESQSSQDKPAEAAASGSTQISVPPPAPVSDPTTPIEDDSPVTPAPVVGDYLKMQFVDYQVVPTILGFFFKYQWNNFLHNVVYDIVQQVFNGPMDRGYNPNLAISLFEAADITNQIINGQLESEKSEKATKTRMGYMGHLTLIAEEVVKFTERHPADVLGEVVLAKVMAPDWVNYVEGPLAETRERDNAILGGVRPDVAMARGGMGAGGAGMSGLGSIGLSSGSGSSALAEAGLGGGQDPAEGGSGGIGPFAISSGTLMSGFGSSSDEDDDDEQDNDDDVANEFRAYTDPLNANTSSMHPPSIPPPPPPPPPLNIPPSRARLQLAARLAMNKRNAAAAANGGEEGTSATSDSGSGLGTFSLPSTSASDRLRNPFADDDDDDDDDDDHRQELGSGSGSDDDDLDTVGRESGSSWNRGSWWRGVVRTARRGSSRRDAEKETERFGDGRDDDTDSEDDAVGDDDIEDEEFGDFAMPETSNAQGGSSTGMVTGIDPAREKLLLKPLPVHPSPGGVGKLTSAASPFTSLWPFSTTVKDTTTAPPANSTEQASSSSVDVKNDQTASTTGTGSITDEPVDLAPEVSSSGSVSVRTEEVDDEEGAAVHVVVGEDGKKIDRAVEATRRTSIEDPDDDDEGKEKVPGGEEIIVGRPSGTAAAR